MKSAEEDKNIHFLVSRVRELEEELKSKESITTYNGTDIRYVADETLENMKEDTNFYPNFAHIKIMSGVTEELQKRKLQGVKIVNR